MLERINLHDFDVFLKENKRPKYINLLLPGAVVSGQVDEITPETIRLGDVSIATGLQNVGMAVLVVPRERILGWGKGNITPPPVLPTHSK